MEAEALAEMGGCDGTAARIALAVNADSMTTWFTGVFAALDDVLFDIRVEDQDHSVRLLREGVAGAVTTERHPVPGCRVQSLGPIGSDVVGPRRPPKGSPTYPVRQRGNETQNVIWQNI